MLTVEGISFGVPMRKKFNLVITLKGLSAVTAAGSVEFGVEFDNVGSSPFRHGQQVRGQMSVPGN